MNKSNSLYAVPDFIITVSVGKVFLKVFGNIFPKSSGLKYN